MGPTLWVRCPICGARVDTGFRIPSSRTVMGWSPQSKTCPECRAGFDYRSVDTFSEP